MLKITGINKKNLMEGTKISSLKWHYLYMRSRDLNDRPSFLLIFKFISHFYNWNKKE